VRIVEIREASVPISHHAEVPVAQAMLTTSIVAIITDIITAEGPVIGYGFSSCGRYAQSGLIRERFARRLLHASPSSLTNVAGTNLDPFRAWETMMTGEKPGGHGERCVAVGTLDMAIWDAAAKIARAPLHYFLADLVGTEAIVGEVPAYAAGGYQYLHEDIQRLSEEVRRFLDQGYSHVKIKIGATSLNHDLERIEAVLGLLQAPDRLAVDGMHAYDRALAMRVASTLRGYGSWWIEDFLDPHDFQGLAELAAEYQGQIGRREPVLPTGSKTVGPLWGVRKSNKRCQIRLYRIEDLRHKSKRKSGATNAEFFLRSH
jgi:D(-)-tartrate dehydratase